MMIKKISARAISVQLSTVMLAALSTTAAANYPVCQSPASDTDADGYGWENHKTCVVNGGGAHTNVNYCLLGDDTDPDDDGWGWENGKSCVVAEEGPDEDDEDEDDENEMEFEKAQLYFELNDTDGDLGFHGLIDGEDWIHLEIDNPLGQELLDIKLDNQLRQQKLTELFFESNEPTFENLEPATFFARFPEGQYLAEAQLADGGELSSRTTVTHLIPAPPSNVTVNGLPVSIGCETNIPTVSEPLTISWDPVTQSHPILGRTGVAVDVARYELVVEAEDTANTKYVQRMPASQTTSTLPALPHQSNEQFKVEVLAREQSDNQTGVEACFRVN